MAQADDAGSNGRTRPHGQSWALGCLLLVAALAGCGGSDAPSEPAPAPTPAPAPAEVPVPVPTGSSPITLTANTPPATFAALQLKVNVGKVTVASPTVVHFAVTDQDGNAVIGLGSTAQRSGAVAASYPNLAFSLAKLVPGTAGSPHQWVSYIVTTVPASATASAAPTRPTTDNTGTLVDHKNGTYSYRFYRDIPKVKEQVAAMTTAATENKADLGDLTFEPTLTHRLTIQISGAAPGTGTNTADAVQRTAAVTMKNPLDVVHDFVPATGKAVAAADSGREITATAKCEECHRKLGGFAGDSSADSAAGFHGGARNEVRYCVVCHTEQRRFGRSEATLDSATRTFKSATYRVDGRAIGNLPNFIHKLHGGKMLSKLNYDYGGVKLNEAAYPQDIRNCTKCHDGSATSTAKTAQGDNWKNVPSVRACGSCHDGIDFATGKGVTLADAARGMKSSVYGHPAGPQADDSLCALCHKPAAVDASHLPVTPPSTASALHVAGGSANTNAAWIASNTARLPSGAVAVRYDIRRVYRNASKQPVMEFRMLRNGARADLNAFASAAVNPATGAKELWDGFMGAPSVYFVFAVPQDGIAAPADFNASASGYLRSLWNGTASGSGRGTLTGPDADGYYTATLTGVTVPDNATMLTGGLGYSYNLLSTLPLTQTDLADYPVSASPAGAANPIGGLIVVAPNNQKVAEGYTGRRAIVDDARCNKCHQELGTFTEESFHGGQRNDGSTCAWCHTPNRASSGWSADSTTFVHAIHAAAKRSVKYTWHATSATAGFFDIGYPGVLSQCETCHLPGTYDFTAATSLAAMPNRPLRTDAAGSLAAGFSTSPHVTPGVAYGSGFSFNAATGATTAAAATTLVSSPTAAACFACHDSALAVSHMTANGGSIYADRASALGRTEQCVLCHAEGRVAGIKAMHSK